MSELDRSQSPDLLIVLGKNIGVGSSPDDIRVRRDHLSQDARLNVLAAGYSWKPDTDILLSTGQTAGTEVAPEAILMRDYLIQRFPHIPLENILLETRSIDTATNAQEVARLVQEQGAKNDRAYRNISLLSVGYHLPRATKLFKNHGVQPNFVYKSEEILVGKSNHLDRYLTGWGDSQRVKAERIKEFMLRRLLLVDPNAKLLGKISARSRK